MAGRNLIASSVTIKRDPATGAQEWHIHGPKPGTAAHARYLEEIKLIVHGGAGGRFEGIFPSNDVVHRAYVSWAYLRFVSALRYDFALSAAARLVADALLSPNLKLFGAAAVVTIDNVPETMAFEPSYPVGITIDRATGEAAGPGWRFGPVAAVIPLRDDQDGAVYRALESGGIGGWEEFDPEVIRAYLTDPGFAPASA